MRKGHVTGHKREKPGASDWYAQQGHEQQWIDKIEQAWAQQGTAQPQQPQEPPRAA